MEIGSRHSRNGLSRRQQLDVRSRESAEITSRCWAKPEGLSARPENRDAGVAASAGIWSPGEADPGRQVCDSDRHEHGDMALKFRGRTLVSRVSEKAGLPRSCLRPSFQHCIFHRQEVC